MELTEILSILILCSVVALAGLLVLLLRRQSAGQGGLSREEVADLIAKANQEAVDTVLRELRREEAAMKNDLLTEIRTSRTETVETVQTAVDRLGRSLRESQTAAAEAQKQLLDVMAQAQDKRLAELTESQNSRMTALTQAQERQMDALAQARKQEFATQGERLDEMHRSVNALLAQQMAAMNQSVNQRLETVEKQFTAFSTQSRESQQQTRQTVEERLAAMQAQNAEQLEKMRATVDEKLQKTLDDRISQSFKLVNERLAEVYQGLGEMKTLAGSVGDLKKVLSGVKTRGILGEIQLGAIMEDMLAPDQYEKNVVTKPGTANPVEYAVCLPGDGDGKVYLPIDAKFPGDTYTHLLDAYDSGDPAAVKEAQKALAARIKGEAKDIHDKYIDPPHTTNFGILFLPVEGLYAEVVRLGLVEELRQQYQVSVAGPTTLSALLNSLQMGFRTLAIQKRSGEVWKVLGAVKTEFSTFEDVLKKAQQRIEQTNDELEKLVGVRTRKINSKLRTVVELPAEDAATLLSDAEEEG
jgi:DNA recombination protein RmuC